MSTYRASRCMQWALSCSPRAGQRETPPHNRPAPRAPLPKLTAQSQIAGERTLEDNRLLQIREGVGPIKMSCAPHNIILNFSRSCLKANKRKQVKLTFLIMYLILPNRPKLLSFQQVINIKIEKPKKIFRSKSFEPWCVCNLQPLSIWMNPISNAQGPTRNQDLPSQLTEV